MTLLVEPGRNRFLMSLRQGAQEFIARRSDVRRFSAGDIVYHAGERLTHVIFPLDGLFSLMRTLQGREIEGAAVGPEGLTKKPAELRTSKAHSEWLEYGANFVARMARPCPTGRRKGHHAGVAFSKGAAGSGPMQP